MLFVSLYQAGPYLLDPFYHAARAPKPGVWRMRELAPDRFFSSEYYRTYYVQTGLAEEVGFFVPVSEQVTVVLSLMRREATGVFSATEFALLKKAEPLVAAFVRHHWAELDRRFDTALAKRAGAAGRRRIRRQTGSGGISTSPSGKRHHRTRASGAFFRIDRIEARHLDGHGQSPPPQRLSEARHFLANPAPVSLHQESRSVERPASASPAHQTPLAFRKLSGTHRPMCPRFFCMPPTET